MDLVGNEHYFAAIQSIEHISSSAEHPKQAVAEASLAVAEEQRIANIIALASLLAATGDKERATDVAYIAASRLDLSVHAFGRL